MQDPAKSISGSGNRKCKGPELGVCIPSLSMSWSQCWGTAGMQTETPASGGQQGHGRKPQPRGDSMDTETLASGGQQGHRNPSLRGTAGTQKPQPWGDSMDTETPALGGQQEHGQKPQPRGDSRDADRHPSVGEFAHR